MADEAMILSAERWAAGDRIIELTDSVGFDATGAGWAFTKATGTWRFFLFTTMADTKGPLWIWERLVKAFSKLHLPEGITPLDIVVASPNEALYGSIPLKMTSITSGNPVASAADMSMTGYGIDHIWLLRDRPEAALLRDIARWDLRDVARSDAAARRFDLKVRQLLAA